MNEVLEKIQKIGIVPVVVLDDAKDAAPLAKALCEGGLPVLRTGRRFAAGNRKTVRSSVHPYYGKRIPGDVSWRRYCSYN